MRDFFVVILICGPLLAIMGWDAWEKRKKNRK